MASRDENTPETTQSLPTPSDCERCPALCENRTQIVNGVGPSDTDILIIGEAPGANEDRTGKPFVGRSGDVLTETLLRNDIHRHEVRITNTVRCKPPENRDPTADERANCSDYLYDEIEAVDPVVIVPVGKIPTEHLLGETVSVTDVAGTPVTRNIREDDRTIIPSVHPAATLYDPSTSDLFTETLRRVAERTGRSPASQASLDEY